MTNQSEKKRMREAEAKKQTYLGVLLGVNVISRQVFYLFFKFVYYYNDLGFWTIIGTIFLSLVSYVTYNGIMGAMIEGVDYEYYLDFFIVNTAVQFLSVFSNYFWLLYLSIPIYLGSFVVKYFFAWADNSGAPEEEEPADMGKKKKDRKEKKEKVKYIRGR